MVMKHNAFKLSLIILKKIKSRPSSRGPWWVWGTSWQGCGLVGHPLVAGQHTDLWRNAVEATKGAELWTAQQLLWTQMQEQVFSAGLNSSRLCNTFMPMSIGWKIRMHKQLFRSLQPPPIIIAYICATKWILKFYQVCKSLLMVLWYAISKGGFLRFNYSHVLFMGLTALAWLYIWFIMRPLVQDASGHPPLNALGTLL